MYHSADQSEAARIRKDLQQQLAATVTVFIKLNLPKIFYLCQLQESMR